MTRISNNSFSKDSIGLRQARLALIEHNNTILIELLGTVTQDVQNWLQTCSTAYETIVLDADAKRNEAEGKTELSTTTLTQLKEQLGTAKKYVLSFYTDDAAHMHEYGIEGDMPKNGEDVVRIAKNVCDVATAHTAAGIAHALPTDLKTTLTSLIQSYQAASLEQKNKSAERNDAKADERQHFNADSKMLRKILSLWISRRGKNDERIALFGMVHPTGGGRTGLPGVPALQLGVTGNSIEITPNTTRPSATSYQTYFRATDGSQDWEEYANNSNTHLPLNNPPLGSGQEYEFHTRARNANGLSEWSTSLVVPAP